MAYGASINKKAEGNDEILTVTSTTSLKIESYLNKLDEWDQSNGSKNTDHGSCCT